MECKNGKWKYGKNGRCQFETKSKCREAEKAIKAREGKKKEKSK